ncbi:LOG family protein [Candidatus Microgenomates bacterium]|nr:LOG family protein [Candidatus Microgenomates bacterium]
MEGAKPSPIIKQISIFGFADAKREDPLYKEAYEAAQVLAQHGYVVINGGGPGVMRAASEGAKAVGGRTIGVTFYPKDIALFEGRDPENPLDQEVVTQNYLERTLKLLELGDAYLIFKGGTGTISEFGMAWGLARLYFGHHKPLILYGKFWEEVIAAFIRSMRMRPEELKVYRIATKPTEVLEAIELFEDLLSHEDHPFNPPERPFEL